MRHTTWITRTGKIPHGLDIVMFNFKQIQTQRPTQTHFRRVPRHHSPMILSGIYTTIEMWAKITIASCPPMAVSAHRKSPHVKESHNFQDVNASWSVVVMQYPGSGKRTGLRSGGHGGLVFQPLIHNVWRTVSRLVGHFCLPKFWKQNKNANVYRNKLLTDLHFHMTSWNCISVVWWWSNQNLL